MELIMYSIGSLAGCFICYLVGREHDKYNASQEVKTINLKSDIALEEMRGIVKATVEALANQRGDFEKIRDEYHRFREEAIAKAYAPVDNGTQTGTNKEEYRLSEKEMNEYTQAVSLGLEEPGFNGTHEAALRMERGD